MKEETEVASEDLNQDVIRKTKNKSQDSDHVGSDGRDLDLYQGKSVSHPLHCWGRRHVLWTVPTKTLLLVSSFSTASLSNWTDAVQTLVWLHNSPSKASDPTVNTNQSPFNGPQDHKALSPVTSLTASHTTCPQAHQAYSWLTDFSLFAPFFWNLLSQNISSLTSLKSLLKRTL